MPGSRWQIKTLSSSVVEKKDAIGKLAQDAFGVWVGLLEVFLYVSLCLFGRLLHGTLRP